MKVDTQTTNEFVVEAILDKKVKARKIQYLVKWKDYPESQATWEPLVNLIGCSELISEFEKKRSTTTTATLDGNTEKKSPKKRKIVSPTQTKSADTLQAKHSKPDETETKENVQVHPPKLAAPAITEDDIKKIPPAFTSFKNILAQVAPSNENTPAPIPPAPVLNLPISKNNKKVVPKSKTLPKAVIKRTSVYDEDSSEFVDMRTDSNGVRNQPLTDKQKEAMKYKEPIMLYNALDPSNSNAIESPESSQSSSTPRREEPNFSYYKGAIDATEADTAPSVPPSSTEMKPPTAVAPKLKKPNLLHREDSLQGTGVAVQGTSAKGFGWFSE